MYSHHKSKINNSTVLICLEQNRTKKTGVINLKNVSLLLEKES